MMRNFVFLLPLSLAIAACSSEPEPEDPEYVTLPESGGDVAADSGTIAPQTDAPAVAAEPPVIEPVSSKQREEAGVSGGTCQFARARGSVPVFVASQSEDKQLVSLSGQLWEMQAQSGNAQRGGSFGTDAITVTVNVTQQRSDSGDSVASMTITNSGGSETIADGIYYCE